MEIKLSQQHVDAVHEFFTTIGADSTEKELMEMFHEWLSLDFVKGPKASNMLHLIQTVTSFIYTMEPVEYKRKRLETELQTLKS